VRPGGTSIRERRVTEIAEIVKSTWDEDLESAFDDLLCYEASVDLLLAGDRIDTGRSEALKNIAGRWGISIREVNVAAIARGRMIGTIADAGRERPQVMEAEQYARYANMFRVTCDNSRHRGRQDFEGAGLGWEGWFEKEIVHAH
jgi:hypothetical protein